MGRAARNGYGKRTNIDSKSLGLKDKTSKDRYRYVYRLYHTRYCSLPLHCPLLFINVIFNKMYYFL